MHGKSAKVSAVDTPFSSEMNCNLFKMKLFIFKTVYALSETPVSKMKQMIGYV